VAKSVVNSALSAGAAREFPYDAILARTWRREFESPGLLGLSNGPHGATTRRISAKIDRAHVT
jgi:hypothetical protein